MARHCARAKWAIKSLLPHRRRPYDAVGNGDTMGRLDFIGDLDRSKIVALEGSNVAQFPMPLLPPSALEPGPKKT